MRLIDADELNTHKFLTPQVKVIGGRHNGKTREQIIESYQKGWNDAIDAIIDNVPTVCGNNPKWCESCVSKGKCASTRPQDEYVDISKLRLMTVEECAGHTIDYAMGWKACIEWIKKGGAE